MLVGAFYLSMQWSREAIAQKRYIVVPFPQKVYEISQSFTSSSGNRKQTRDTDSCLDRRDGIFFNYVLRWHCKPLALVCSHHGLAITDSHYSQRIPLLFLGLQPLHPIHSEFISNCLCDIEQCTIASRCSELKSIYHEELCFVGFIARLPTNKAPELFICQIFKSVMHSSLLVCTRVVLLSISNILLPLPWLFSLNIWPVIIYLFKFRQVPDQIYDYLRFKKQCTAYELWIRFH